MYVDSAVTRVSCAVQLEIEREYPEYVRFLEPFPCKGTHQGIGGQALLVEARRCWHRDTRSLPSTLVETVSSDLVDRSILVLGIV